MFFFFNFQCPDSHQGTAQAHILSGDDPGRCQARNGQCWGDPGQIKQVVLLSVTQPKMGQQILSMSFDFR